MFLAAKRGNDERVFPLLEGFQFFDFDTAPGESRSELSNSMACGWSWIGVGKDGHSSGCD